MSNVLGISALYHDAAATLVSDGEVVAAAQEERFSRIKHDPSLPVRAIEMCLAEGDVAPDDIDLVVYYEKPVTKLARILHTSSAAGRRGLRPFRTAVPDWLRRKLWVSAEIERALVALGYRRPARGIHYLEHHQSHAASAFFPSPFESAAILTFDGVGEWATTSIGVGRGNRIELQRQVDFPDSLGLLYSAFTSHCGFRVNSGEYKLMGLAPYGSPRFVDDILGHVVHLGDEGAFSLDPRYFDFLSLDRMTTPAFDERFGGPARVPEGPLTEREADLAASIQEVIERIVLRLAAGAAVATGESRAVLAGGVALNCVANSRLRRDGPFDEIWVQPAAGDAGGSLGAALYGWHHVLDGPRVADGRADGMRGCLLGPRPDPTAEAWADSRGYPCARLAPAERADRIARLLADGQVVAVMAGRAEFGPRALGNRSILADARDPSTQVLLNRRIKLRESFRPFAPAVLAERADEWFDLDRRPSPYMSFTATVAAAHRHDPGEHPADLGEWAAQARSDIPAVTHVDGSARVQTVDAEIHPDFHAILSRFESLTGCPVLVNTSFNVRGEPMVGTVDDAYRCFMATDIDALVIDDLLFLRADQPAAEPVPAGVEFVLD